MSGYIGTQPVPQATQHRESFTATSGQTSFATAGYTPQFLDVYLNGVHLLDGTDYTATNGSDVVLTPGAASGDVLEVVSYSTYEVNSQNYTGGLTVDNDGATVLTVDRATSDGTIIDVQKNGTTVGSIGSSASGQYLHIGSDDVGLTFAPNVDSIIPFNVVTGAYNANVDLGYASGTKFRNIYLNSGVYVDGGGGVYLGGTGSANKLDDYETGTWTPTFTLGTWSYNKQYGRYTKVGNLVTVWYSITWGARSGSGALEVTSLPFTPFAGDGDARAGGALGTHTGLDTSGGKQIVTAIDGNINKILYRFMNDNATWSGVNLQDCDPVGEVQGTFTYRA